MLQRNLAVELLRKLLSGEIQTRRRKNVRAQLQVLVKRIRRKYGYPPDRQERATQTVLDRRGFFPRRGLLLDAGMEQPI
jgi:type I restriction enzyme R subunit